MSCGTAASCRCCTTAAEKGWRCSSAVTATAGTWRRCRSGGDTGWCAERAGGGRGPAVLARAALLPLAAAYRVVMRLRTAVYRRGWRAVRRLPAPAIAVGNLSVGGTGKTPLAAWIARYCARHGRRPAILLRGYGGDEPLVHRRAVPEAGVLADPDPVAGGGRPRAVVAPVPGRCDPLPHLAVSACRHVAPVYA